MAKAQSTFFTTILRSRQARWRRCKTQSGAKTMALDPKTHQLFLSAAEYGVSEGQKKGKSMKPGSFAVLVFAK